MIFAVLRIRSSLVPGWSKRLRPGFCIALWIPLEAAVNRRPCFSEDLPQILRHRSPCWHVVPVELLAFFVHGEIGAASGAEEAQVEVYRVVVPGKVHLTIVGQRDVGDDPDGHGQVFDKSQGIAKGYWFRGFGAGDWFLGPELLQPVSDYLFLHFATN